MADPSLGIVFAIIAAFCWSAHDILRKQLTLRVSSVTLLWGLVALQAPLFLLGTGLDRAEFDESRYALPGLAVVILNLGANLAFIRALEIGALSRTIPILSLTPAMTIASAAALVGEMPQPQQALGIALAVAGSLLLAVNRQGGGLRAEPGTLLMFGVAVTWSITAAIDKVALAAASAPTHGFIQSIGLWLALSVAFAIRPSQERRASLETLYAARGRLLLAAAVSALASTLQFWAIERTLVSVVETIKRAIGNGLALAVGAAYFREAVGPRQMIATVLLVAGTALILSAA